MTEGGLHPRGLIDDALTIAALETGIGVAAFDADRLAGPPRLRADSGRLVVADDEGAISMLFGNPLERAAIHRRTRRLALVAVAVPNVADIFVEEALWIAWDILR
jgi:DNA/RNA-binding domain of Phe-tRNA-synthetase-like protein